MRLFSSFLLSAIKVVSSAYLRLLIFLPAILIPGYASSNLALRSRVTICSLDILLSDLEAVCCSMSSSNCCFLICIRISQEAGQVVWYAHLSQNFPLFVMIYTVKGFGVINKVEVDVFLEFSCCFDDTIDVGNLISGSSACLNI